MRKEVKEACWDALKARRKRISVKKRGREGEQAQLMMTQRNTEVGGCDERMIKKVGGKSRRKKVNGDKEEAKMGEITP